MQVAWVAQLVKMSDFDSVHNLRVLESSLTLGSALVGSLLLPLPPLLALPLLMLAQMSKLNL